MTDTGVPAFVNITAPVNSPAAVTYFEGTFTRHATMVRCIDALTIVDDSLAYSPAIFCTSTTILYTPRNTRRCLTFAEKKKCADVTARQLEQKRFGYCITPRAISTRSRWCVSLSVVLYRHLKVSIGLVCDWLVMIVVY